MPFFILASSKLVFSNNWAPLFTPWSVEYFYFFVIHTSKLTFTNTFFCISKRIMGCSHCFFSLCRHPYWFVIFYFTVVSNNYEFHFFLSNHFGDVYLFRIVGLLMFHAELIIAILDDFVVAILADGVWDDWSCDICSHVCKSDCICCLVLTILCLSVVLNFSLLQSRTTILFFPGMFFSIVVSKPCNSWAAGLRSLLSKSKTSQKLSYSRKIGENPNLANRKECFFFLSFLEFVTRSTWHTKRLDGQFQIEEAFGSLTCCMRERLCTSIYQFITCKTLQ